MKVARTFRIEESFAETLESISKAWSGAEGKKVSQAGVIERTFALYTNAKQELDGGRNWHLPKEIIEVLRWWGKRDGVVDTEILVRAVTMYDAARSDPLAAPSQAPVSPPRPPRTDGTFSCRCEHSGCQGSKFMGVSKFSTLCPECEAAGHRGDRHDCSECWNPA